MIAFGKNMVYQKYIKRVFDLLLGVLFLVLFGWLLGLISVLIWLADGSPVLFRQERIGFHGKPFCIYKFRTMVKNAEQIGSRSTSDNDPRITAVGKVLRKTSLDELAQILNVIKGDMSFVGFRPGVRENYTDDDYKSGIFNVKPGITGYAQVNGRSSLSVEEVRRWEMQYVKDISLITDIKVILKTFTVVLKRSGVN